MEKKKGEVSFGFKVVEIEMKKKWDRGCNRRREIGQSEGEGTERWKRRKDLMKFSNVYDDKFENFHGHPDYQQQQNVFTIFSRKNKKNKRKENLDFFLRTSI